MANPKYSGECIFGETVGPYIKARGYAYNLINIAHSLTVSSNALPRLYLCVLLLLRRAPGAKHLW